MSLRTSPCRRSRLAQARTLAEFRIRVALAYDIPSAAKPSDFSDSVRFLKALPKTGPKKETSEKQPSGISTFLCRSPVFSLFSATEGTNHCTTVALGRLWKCKLINYSRSYAGTVGWSKTMIEIREVPGSSPAWERFFQPCCYPRPQSTGNLWPGTRGTWMQLMGSFSALVPVVVRLTHPPPPLGAASAARVYRVLAAVVSSLRERTR